MRRLQSDFTTRDQRHLNKDFEALDVRIGKYYSKLPDFHKTRFNRLEGGYNRYFGLQRNQAPIHQILIRQIALHTIFIENLDLKRVRRDLCEEPITITPADEKRREAYVKERKEAIQTLFVISQNTHKQDGVNKFEEMTNALRKQEKLPPVKVEYKKDGHDRRFHNDGVLRTKT